MNEIDIKFFIDSFKIRKTQVTIGHIVELRTASDMQPFVEVSVADKMNPFILAWNF